MKRVALYVRVSNEEQVKHGISVDSQIDALQKFSADHDYSVVDIYNDAGISARKSYKKRPDLLRMIEDCKQKKIDLILITKLDRFFRSVPDYYAVMGQIGNVPWRAIWEDYETETANGVFKVNIMLSVAQSEADRTSERIKRVFDYKREKGEVCSGGVGTGYIIKDKQWYKDPEKQEAVQAFFDKYLSTFSVVDALRTYRSYGFQLSKGSADKMIYKEAYCGLAPYVKEAYITPEQHDLILAHKRHGTVVKKYHYAFSGLLKCKHCGRSLSGNRTIHERKDGTFYHSIGYYCQNSFDGCPVTSIGENKLEAYLISVLDEEFNKYQLLLKTAPESDAPKKIEKLKARQARLADLYEMGDIDIGSYKQKRTLLQTQILELQKVKVSEPITLKKNWKELYLELDAQHKNVFWSTIIDHMIVPTRKATSVEIVFR